MVPGEDAKKEGRAMSLAYKSLAGWPTHLSVDVSDPAQGPLVLNPGELRQLWQDYYDLLELHRSEVVEDEQFESARKLLVERLVPLREILRNQERLVVDPRAECTL
jgi:hypothetical protein